MILIYLQTKNFPIYYIMLIQKYVKNSKIT